MTVRSLSDEGRDRKATPRLRVVGKTLFGTRLLCPDDVAQLVRERRASTRRSGR